MGALAYNQILGDSPDEAKEKEKAAFDHAIALLRDVSDGACDARQKIDALLFVERLWSILLEDLSSPGNSLPNELKAKLISIGIWIMKEVVALRQGVSKDFATLIEINQVIRDGLD